MCSLILSLDFINWKSSFNAIQPFPNQKILNSSTLKESADDNFKFDENGRKFSKQVENTARKGEIARFEQFLLFSPLFLKDL